MNVLGVACTEQKLKTNILQHDGEDNTEVHRGQQISPQRKDKVTVLWIVPISLLAPR